jgi:hypothetical protein
MGKDSVAKIPVYGKVDTFHEVMLNTYATSFDALNLILLDNDYPGLIVNERLLRMRVPQKEILKLFRVVDERSFILILNGRFNILKNLALRINEIHKRNYAYQKLNAIEALLYNLLERYPLPSASEAVNILRNEILDALHPVEAFMVENRIETAEKTLIEQIAKSKLRLKHK